LKIHIEGMMAETRQFME